MQRHFVVARPLLPKAAMGHRLHLAEPRSGHAIPTPILALLLGILMATPAEGNPLKVGYLYSLSDFSGTIPTSYAKLYLDAPRDELYVADGTRIRVFNATGMEIYRFGEHSDVRGAYGMAVSPSGDVYILAYDFSNPGAGPKYAIAWCDYRGEVRDWIRISGLPAGYSVFAPQDMFYRDETFLLVDRVHMLAVEADRNGAVVKSYDLGTLIGVEEKDRPNTQMFGFCVDGEGNMFFTVAVHFQVYRVSPDGQVAFFGKAGSLPGRFGIVAGIAVDSRGNLFVSDKRRHVVMVFDRDFNFLQEFGGYGLNKENLVYPDDLCVDSSGKVYVSQMLNRGVAVFQLSSVDGA